MTTYAEAYAAAVAAELRAERARARVTIASLVAETGLSKSAILTYLNGKRDIPTQALIDICRALGVAPRVIFDRAAETLEDD